MTKVIGVPFKKGQSGNPSGRPALPIAIRKERKRNQHGFLKLVAIYANMTHQESYTRLAGPDVHQIEEIVQGLIESKRGRCPGGQIRTGSFNRIYTHR
jgi:hypothetical protein